jgi:hypothetical protein
VLDWRGVNILARAKNDFKDRISGMFFSHHPQVLSRSEVWLMLRKENKI